MQPRYLIVRLKRGPGENVVFSFSPGGFARVGR